MMNPLPSLLPLGFRFDPSDEELISYLIRRATGLSLLPSGADHQHIVERQLYGDMANPWHVFHGLSDVHWDIISEMGDDDDEDGKDKRVMYVVTKLTKISKGKTRIARRAGCGTWSGQTPPKKIYNESTGQWVGTMRMLSFERPKGEEQYHHDPRDQHHWIMHEYSLDGIYNNNNNNNSNKVDKEYVICRITRIFKGKSKNNNINGISAQQLVHEEEEQDVVHVAEDTPCSKKRKREISKEFEVEGRRSRFHGHMDHVVVSSSAGEEEEEEEEARHESVSVLQTMAHDQQQTGECDSDPDFDHWTSLLDDVLVDLPEEEEEDHNLQEAASKEMVVADPDNFDDAAPTTMAGWMSLLDDVELPDEDEDLNSNHNNTTMTTGFNLDHLDLFQELCY